jgi:hypothetical protein
MFQKEWGSTRRSWSYSIRHILLIFIIRRSSSDTTSSLLEYCMNQYPFQQCSIAERSCRILNPVNFYTASPVYKLDCGFSPTKHCKLDSAHHYLLPFAGVPSSSFLRPHLNDLGFYLDMIRQTSFGSLHLLCYLSYCSWRSDWHVGCRP